MPKLYSIEDGKLRLKLHWGQSKARMSSARVIVVVAGSQGGKTSWGPWWLRDRIEEGGAGDYIAATATYDLFKLKMLPEIREVFEHVLRIGRYHGGNHKIMEICDPQTGKFLANRADDPMWGRIILRSASSGGGLESATAKAAWLDEAGMDEFPLSAYEGVQRRLTLNQGRMLITTTPYNLGWLKTELMDKDGQEGIQVINFPSTANPSFPKEEFERLRRIWPTWKFDMFMRGLLSRPPGMIFFDFIDGYRDSEVGGHIVHPFDIPQDWPRFVGIDPGANNTAKVWWAYDPLHRIFYQYRESLDGGKTTATHVKETKELAEKGHENVVMYFLGQKSETQQRWDWAAEGIQNISGPPIHDVESGLDKMIELLKSFRLYIFDTCTGTLDQVRRYRRKLDNLGQVTTEIEHKETFHYIDAGRYNTVGALSMVDNTWEAMIA